MFNFKAIEVVFKASIDPVVQQILQEETLASNKTVKKY